MEDGAYSSNFVSSLLVGSGSALAEREIADGKGRQHIEVIAQSKFCHTTVAASCHHPKSKTRDNSGKG